MIQPRDLLVPNLYFDLHERFIGVFLHIGLVRCSLDHCLLSNKLRYHYPYCICGDIMLTGDDIVDFKGYLGREFDIKELGFLKYFIGL